MESFIDRGRGEGPSFMALLGWTLLALSAPAAALAVLHGVADEGDAVAAAIGWLLEPSSPGAALDRHAALLVLLGVNAALGVVAACVLLRLVARRIARRPPAAPR